MKEEKMGSTTGAERPTSPQRARQKSVLGGGHREKYGVIVSASTDEGDWVSLHAPGFPDAALLECVQRLDALEGRWYIDVICTPQTIYDDITNDGRGREGDYRWMRERIRLTRIGRLDLLRVPRVTRKSDSSKPQGHGWRGHKVIYK